MMMQSGVDMRTFAPQLKELFETALPAWSDPPMSMEGHKDHGDVLGYRHYVNKFVGEDGKEYYIRFTVREHKGTPGRKGVHAATVSEVAIYASNLSNNPAYGARERRRALARKLAACRKRSRSLLAGARVVRDSCELDVLRLRPRPARRPYAPLRTFGCGKLFKLPDRLQQNPKSVIIYGV